MKLKALAIFTFAIVGASHASETYVCPSHIDISSGTVQVNALPEGFDTLVSQTTGSLTGSNVYYGHPKKQAALIPTSTSDHGNASTWKFEGDFPEGKWLSCDYEQGFARLVRRIDDTAKSCTSKNRWINRAEKELEVSFVCQ
jgi:hypothetical protein